MNQYERHELSAAWPEMSAEEFQILRDSLTVSGQLDDIVLFEGQVLDGWQRYQGCLAEGIEPRFREFEGTGEDASDFVEAKHARRSLTLTQRLTAIALMHNWRARGRTAAPDPKCANSAHLPEEGGKSANSSDLTAADMATRVGASTRTAVSVKAAITHGVPEVTEAMRAGTLPAYKAEEIAKLPANEQVEALAAPKPAKFKGKPKKVPATKLFAAEIKAVEMKKAAEGAEARVDSLEQEVAALREQLAAEHEENVLLSRILEQNDPLAQAAAEAKQATSLARGLQTRINSMLTEIAELKRSVKHWQKKAGQAA